MLKSQKTMLALSEKRQKQTELAEKVNASAVGRDRRTRSKERTSAGQAKSAQTRNRIPEPA